MQRDQRMTAVTAVWEALRPLGLGLYEAEQVVHARYQALGDRVQRASPDPLDVPSLTTRAAALPGRLVAVEALWDGDTVHNWFVLLVAVLDDPPGEGHLATVRRRPGGRPPGPTAAAAGAALAHRLEVPFHFTSPDIPDDEAPLRREARHRREGQR
ncbi:hypothetical protein AB0L71_28875 [Streptomyces sp. NPDC052052]|uniref:hypothetical protein n=1 Tax=Streptomyces sp. NPDC052052 TaxID=3154756 RepID=UPI003426F60A